MKVKNNKLIIYQSNLLNTDLISFVIKSKNIVSTNVKKQLLIEWYKTKWLIKNNKAFLFERDKLDQPSTLDVLTSYIIQKNLWKIGVKIPWAYFVALALGLKPEKEKAWVVVWPANVGLSVYQANLKVLPGSTLDNKRKIILTESILKFGGEIFFPKENVDFFLVKLPKKFSVLFDSFPGQVSELSSYNFSARNEPGRLWRTLMTEVEMEWFELEPHAHGVNSLWTWGWGHMPNEPEHLKKITIKDEYEKNDSNEIVSLVKHGLGYWLQTLSGEKFTIDIINDKSPNIDIYTLKSFSKMNENEVISEEIKTSFQSFTENLREFNKSIQNNEHGNNIFITNNIYTISKGEDYFFSNLSKFLLNIKSLLFWRK